MASYVQNMTTGSEMKHIVKFTLPLLAGNLFQQLYNIVDSVIVGKHLGANALAAVGATGSMTYFFYSLCIGLSIGAGILISQSFGAGKKREVKVLIVNSAYAAAIFGVLISVVSFLLAEPLLRLLKTPESLMDMAVEYMKIAGAGTISVAVYNWINAVMRALGDSKTPLYFLVAASVINVVLDIVFVMFLETGAAGAAYATIIAQTVSAAGCIMFAFAKVKLFRFGRRTLEFDAAAFAKCVKTGVPIALQNSMISVSMIYLQSVANSFGETVMAAYTATMRVEQLLHQPFSSLGAALSTFAGQNMGAGKLERTVKGYSRSMKLMAAFSLVMLAVFMVLSEKIVWLFVDEPEVIEIGAKALKLSAFFYIPLGTIHVTRGLLNGAGDVGYAMINGFVEVIGRIGFALLLVELDIIGMWAVWTTTCLTWVLTGVMSYIRYKHGIWKGKVLITADK
ncbi:MAG: MATE family efflux transporter [Oscillospiraceae bacterium]|nr:MATE family efflux transporter [Oscillospiraceae bacterium]